MLTHCHYLDFIQKNIDRKNPILEVLMSEDCLDYSNIKDRRLFLHHLPENAFRDYCHDLCSGWYESQQKKNASKRNKIHQFSVEKIYNFLIFQKNYTNVRRLQKLNKKSLVRFIGELKVLYRGLGVTDHSLEQIVLVENDLIRDGTVEATNAKDFLKNQFLCNSLDHYFESSESLEDVVDDIRGRLIDSITVCTNPRGTITIEHLENELLRQIQDLVAFLMENHRFIEHNLYRETVDGLENVAQKKNFANCAPAAIQNQLAKIHASARVEESPLDKILDNYSKIYTNYKLHLCA
jgi:hypothetical protein